VAKSNSVFSVITDAINMMCWYGPSFSSRGVHLDFCPCALSYDIRVDTEATCVGIYVPSLQEFREYG
jgi:hypothetical protein